MTGCCPNCRYPQTISDRSASRTEYIWRLGASRRRHLAGIGKDQDLAAAKRRERGRELLAGRLHGQLPRDERLERLVALGLVVLDGRATAGGLTAHRARDELASALRVSVAIAFVVNRGRQTILADVDGTGALPLRQAASFEVVVGDLSNAEVARLLKQQVEVKQRGGLPAGHAQPATRF